METVGTATPQPTLWASSREAIAGSHRDFTFGSLDCAILLLAIPMVLEMVLEPLFAIGLEPGLGVLHVDTPNRDSLACDLMESVRPQVDAYVLDWITREPLRREWFFEQRDGNCRLMGSFAARLSETAPTWGRAVAPFAEWIARTPSSTITKPNRQISPATRLTATT